MTKISEGSKPIPLNVLYIYAGAKRNASVQEWVKRLSSKEQVEARFTEVDILSGRDVMDEKLWDGLMTDVRAIKYDVVMATPPCNEARAPTN